MKVLIVDTETTGLDSQTDHCIEVAGILLDAPTKSEIASFSFLLPCEGPNGAVAINGITDEALASIPDSPLWQATAIAWATYLYRQADVIVAHNAAFDIPWLEKIGLKTKKPFLCSREDLTIPGARAGKLGHMAVDLGLAVSKLHRAAADVRLLGAVLCTVDDLDALLHASMGPKTVMRACVPYDRRDEAKTAGFVWHHATKTWRKKLSDSEILYWNGKFGIEPIL